MQNEQRESVEIGITKLGSAERGDVGMNDITTNSKAKAAFAEYFRDCGFTDPDFHELRCLFRKKYASHEQKAERIADFILSVKRRAIREAT